MKFNFTILLLSWLRIASLITTHEYVASTSSKLGVNRKVAKELYESSWLAVTLEVTLSCKRLSKEK